MLLAAVTESHVRLILAKEDQAEIESNPGAALHLHITAGMLISQGLDLEIQQYVVMYVSLMRRSYYTIETVFG